MSLYKKLLSLSNFSIVLFFILLTFVTYFNILPNQLFYDDEELIYKNAYVKDLRFFPKYFTENMIAGAGKKSNMYRPILLVSFALDHLIWKGSQIGYHLTSIFLHAVNAVLIFFLIWKLFKDKLLSFLTSLFFIVHPVNSEAVIYASGRTDPLYTFFLLCSLIFFLYRPYLSSVNLQSVNHPKGDHVRRGLPWGVKSVSHILSIIFFIFALLSKETAIVLPILLLLIYLVKPYNQKPQRRLWKRLIFLLSPFFFVDTVYILLRLTILNFSSTLNFYQTPTLYSQNLLIRLYTFAHVFFQYLGVLVFPADLIFARQADYITSPLNLWVFLFLFTVGIFTIIIIKSRKKRGFYIFTIFWFFITLLPVSGIIPINSIIAEHYLYLPSISFFLIVSYFFVSLWKKCQNLNPTSFALPIHMSFRAERSAVEESTKFYRGRSLHSPPACLRRQAGGSVGMTNNAKLVNSSGVSRVTKYLPCSIYRIILISFLTIIYLTLFIRTIIRTFDWRDPITFYTKSIQQSPDNIPMHHNLAMAYAEKGNYELAIKEYQNLIILADVYPNTHHNLANALKEIGKYKEAEEEYMKALKMDPNFSFSYYGLADLYQKTGEKEKLEEILKNF